MTSHNLILRPLAPLIAVIGLAACQPALIYGERTSFNLAAVHLNDDVSEPVKINFGLSRSVATVAPPRGGEDQEQEVEVTNSDGLKTKVKVRSGDAVSVFSNFDLAYLGNRNDVTLPPPLPLTTEDLNIRTRFASGQAAIDVSGNAQVVTAILGVRTVPLDTRETVDKKEALIKCVEQINDKDKLEAITREFPQSIPVLIFSGSLSGTRDSIISAIAKLNPSELEIVSRFKELAVCK